MTRHPADGLSPRQVQILTLVAEGFSDVDLASTLHLSRPTVHRHLLNARRRLGARNRAHAVALGFRTGVLR